MKIEALGSNQYVDDIVDIHIRTFPGFFLTFLGRGFLKHLYKGYISHKESNVIGAFDKGRLVGFLAYSRDISGFYRYLIRRSLFPFAFYSVLAFFRKPRVMFRILRAFTYSKDSSRDEAYIELSSIGVLPETKNKGIGTLLINALKESVDGNGFSYIKLETDKLNNDSVNAFYIKNYFELNKSYITKEGREMNEYHYRLKSSTKESIQLV